MSAKLFILFSLLSDLMKKKLYSLSLRGCVGVCLKLFFLNFPVNCSLFRVVPDPKKDDPTPKQRITLNWSEDDDKGVRS